MSTPTEGDSSPFNEPDHADKLAEQERFAPTDDVADTQNQDESHECSLGQGQTQLSAKIEQRVADDQHQTGSHDLPSAHGQTNSHTSDKLKSSAAHGPNGGRNKSPVPSQTLTPQSANRSSNESVMSRMLPSILDCHVGSEGYTTFREQAWLLQTLDNGLKHQRWKTQFTDGKGLLCLIHALSISLLAIGAIPQLSSPEYIKDLKQSARYFNFVRARFPTLGEQALQETYLGPNNFSSDVALVLLHLLGQDHGEEYMLAECTTLREWPWEYSVHAEKLENHEHVTKTVWIHNNNHEQLYGHGILNHWSGIGPAYPYELWQKPRELDTSIPARSTFVSAVPQGFGAYMPMTPESDRAPQEAAGAPSPSANDAPNGNGGSRKRPREDDCDDDQGAEQKQAKRQRIRNRQVASRPDTLAGPITQAPPANTSLPLEQMDKITSEELVAFFPNHALTWPAIAARIMADFGTYVEVEKRINHYWNEISGSEPGDFRPAVLANSIRNPLNRACAEFFDDYDPPEKWRAVFNGDGNGKGKWTDDELRSHFNFMKWEQPKANKRTSFDNPLWKPWTLQHIGNGFCATLHRAAKFPSGGVFANLVRSAMHQRTPQSVQGEPSSEQPIRRQENHNPPSQPEGWRPTFESPAQRARREKTEQEKRRLQAKKQHRAGMIDPKGASECLFSEIDPDIHGNLELIMQRHFGKIAGELLLGLMTKKEKGGAGFKQHDISDAFFKEGQRRDREQALQGTPQLARTKPIDRSTVAYRKRTALVRRAKAAGVDYDQLYADFERNQLQTERPRKLPEKKAGHKRNRLDDQADEVSRTPKKARISCDGGTYVAAEDQLQGNSSSDSRSDSPSTGFNPPTFAGTAGPSNRVENQASAVPPARPYQPMQNNLQYVETAVQNGVNQINPNIDPRFWSFGFQGTESSVQHPWYHQQVLHQTPQFAPEQTARFQDLTHVNDFNRNTNDPFGGLGNAGSGSASVGNNLVASNNVAHCHANLAPLTTNASAPSYFAPGQASPSRMTYVPRTGGGTADSNEPYTPSQGDSVPHMPDMIGIPGLTGIPVEPYQEQETAPQTHEYPLNGTIWNEDQDQEGDNGAMLNGDVFEQGQEGRNDVGNDPNEFDWIV